MTKPQLWNKDFLIDSLVNFFIYLVYYLLMVIIAGYAMDNLQASPSEAGLAAGIFILGAFISRIISGRLIELVGRKKMLYTGLTVYLIATLLYFKVTNLQLLFFIRLLHGAGFGIASVSTGTIVADIIPYERRGEGISYFAMSTTAASAIGPFLGMYLNQKSSFHTILMVCLFLLVISYSAILFLKVKEVELTKEQLVNLKKFRLRNFIEFNALSIAVIGAIIGVSYSSIISFLSSYVKEINLINAGSLFFIVYSIAILISRPLTGRWFDLKGENFVMYPSFLIFSFGLVILSQAHQGYILLLAGVCIGLGFGTFMSSGQAIAINLTANHRIGLLELAHIF